MSRLSGFSAKVAAELSAADGPSVDREHEAEFMAQVTSRKRDFDRQSRRLLDEIVRPHMEVLAGCFPNATPARNSAPDHCVWWFGYTERFPSSVKVDLSATHDETLENIVINYELTIFPAYTNYERFDRFTMPLGQIDDEGLTDWLESRLIKFVRTYVAIENSNQDQSALLVTDPVCGMRIVREAAVAEVQRSGHSYFFCSQSCRDAFEENPARYARLVTA